MIDALAHLYPPAFVEYVQQQHLPMPLFFQHSSAFTNAETRMQEIDRVGIEMQALALGSPAFDDWFTSGQLL